VRLPASRRRLYQLLPALAVVAATVFIAPGPAQGEVVEPDYVTEAWFFRGKPRAPQAEIPDTPVRPGGEVAPVNPPAPQAPDGAFVVSSAGGSEGADQGDVGWAAFEWDVLDALNGTADQFVVTFTQEPDNRGDFGTAKVQACNIAAAWAGNAGANPWPDRPFADCSQAVKPTVGKAGGNATYTFDLTPLAQTWVEGKGYGAAFVPGVPGGEDQPLTPFQLTFAGYSSPSGSSVAPSVTFRFTPGEDPFAGGEDAPSLELSSEPSIGSDDSGGLAPAGDLDLIPTDEGSEPDLTPAPSETSGGGESGAGDQVAAPRTQPVSRDTGFAMALLLLLPLAALAFWSTGTALGPAGEPAPVRQGGVSRVLAERRAARAAGELPPIDTTGDRA
jgi:hypothetical protein